VLVVAIEARDREGDGMSDLGRHLPVTAPTGTDSHRTVGSGDQPGDRPGSRRRHLRLVGRAMWNLVDQALSAATNVALAIVVVKAVGTHAFDAFAVAFLLFSTAIGIERSLVGSALNVRHSKEVGSDRRRTVSRATGTVLGLSIPAALGMLGAGLLLGGRLGSALVATGCVLPLLVMQDVCRYAFFSGAQSRRAAASDALWAVVQFSIMGVLIATGRATVVTLILAWGGAAGVCVVVALAQLRAVPDPSATRGWIREHRDLVGYLFGDYLLTTGAFNGGYLMVGAILGDQAVGSIRAAQVLLGPLGIIAGAARSFALPELSRRAEHVSSATRRRIAVVVAAAMAALSLLYAGAIMLAPDALGELAFSAKWAEAQEVLLPLALAQVATGSALGPAIVIYALGQARRTFRIMTIEAPLVFSLMLTGAVLFGVRGAAWAQFVDQFLVIVLWFGTLRNILAERDSRSGPGRS
jgi:O-antigen/teichoic acid export membrane protein